MTNHGGLHDELVDDWADFQRLSKALIATGYKKEEMGTLFETIAALLHIGNISFVENADDNKGKQLMCITSKVVR